MWCRAEQLCHTLRNGISHMYLATAPDDVCKLESPEFENPSVKAAQKGTQTPSPESPESSFSKGRRKSKANNATSQMMAARSKSKAHVDAKSNVMREVRMESNWLDEMLCCFHGDVTKEEDTIALVLPILGLYAEVYATRDIPQLKTPFLRM
eukprot:5578680-Prymnesium_polylepis.1